MHPPPLTIEQQKDYVRRYIEGCRAAEQIHIDEARTRTDAEAWVEADSIMQDWRGIMAATPPQPEDNGLVEQQRWFGRARQK